MIPPVAQLAAFLGASLALLLTPGPAVLYIVASSVAGGRRAGLRAAVGLACGGMVHVAATTLGAAALLAASPRAFAVLRHAGAAYLLYLGLRQLVRPAAPGRTRAEPPAASRRRQLVEGMLVSLLNPKAIVFFLAFLPQFADPARGPLAPQLLLLGSLFLLLALATDSGYALAAGSAARWIRARPSLGTFARYVSSAVYVALAAATVAS